MAHSFDIHPAVSPMTRIASLDSPEILQARIDLAACFRMAAKLSMAEGICNHFSFVLPGHPQLFLVNPFGLAFAEVTASSLLICDFQGRVLAGEGQPRRRFTSTPSCIASTRGPPPRSIPICPTRRRCACSKATHSCGPGKQR